ncbi:MAG TPA: FAD-binding oxidoreductase [bacterium]|mgnify:CR=1 FL=1|nr:FAD-binding oxidoreductase [bacterium]
MSGKKFTPDWTEKAPEPGSYRSIFKFGEPNEFKHPRAELVEMMMSEFGVTEEYFSHKQNEGNEKVSLNGKPGLSDEHINALKEIVGSENVSTNDYDRVKYSHGQTMKEVMGLRMNKPRNVTDAVAHPRDKNDVRRIVEYCDKHRIPVCVYGGGSSVVMGIAPEKGGVTLVMKTHMNKLLSINEANQTATVQPGMMGPDFEAALNNAPQMFKTARRYTCGHFPQSFEMSSVGGWIAALGSGQASTYYGDAYHLAISQEYVTPAGTFKTLEYPATATGPKLNDIMKGSEGAFGALVEITMKIFRFMPENRQYFAFMFPSWEAAVNASREIMQSEFGLPAVYRISDPEETDRGLKLYGFDNAYFEKFMSARVMKPMSRCVCMGTVEGEKGYAKHVKKSIGKVCRANGAMKLPAVVVKAWEKTRYKEPLMREDFLDFGIVTDTLESAVTWDNLLRLHKEVRAVVKSRPGSICMTHASHFYPNGTNLYFIFVLKPERPEEYNEVHSRIVSAIVENGGSLSHHHGVGKLLSPWMETHLGKTQMDALRALKTHFDPNNIMNPGGQLALNSESGT